MVKAKKSKPKDKPTFCRVELQMRPGMLSEIDEAAERLGMKRAEFIRYSCVEQLKREAQAGAVAGEGQS